MSRASLSDCSKKQKQSDGGGLASLESIGKTGKLDTLKQELS